MDAKRTQLKLQQLTTAEALAFLDLEEARQNFMDTVKTQGGDVAQAAKKLYAASQVYTSTLGTLTSAVTTTR